MLPQMNGDLNWIGQVVFMLVNILTNLEKVRQNEQTRKESSNPNKNKTTQKLKNKTNTKKRTKKYEQQN
jgi:hypothetical protein